MFTQKLLLQSFGAKQFSSLGIYLQRALLVSLAASIFIIVMWLQLDKLLVILGEDNACCAGISVPFVPALPM